MAALEGAAPAAPAGDEYLVEQAPRERRPPALAKSDRIRIAWQQCDDPGLAGLRRAARLGYQRGSASLTDG